MATSRNFGPLSRIVALIVALGLGATLAACADIHPEPDDPGGGIIDSPTDEAERFQEHREELDEHGGGNRRN